MNYEKKLSRAIKKINRSVDEKMIRISHDAVEQLNLICRALLRRIYASAMETLYNDSGRLLDEKTAIKALFETMVFDELPHYLDVINSALNRYKESKNNNSSVRQSIAEKSGLILSPSLVAHYLLISVVPSPINLRTTTTAKITIASVMEDLLRNILIATHRPELLGQKRTVGPREVLLASRSSQELTDLFTKHRIMILRAGVMPYTPEFLSVGDNKSKRSKKAKKGVTTPKKIVELQSNTNTILRKTFIRNMMISLLGGPTVRYKIEPGLVEDIANYVENRVVSLIRETLELSHIASENISLFPLLLVRVAEIQNIILRETISQPSRSSAVNIANKAGAIRIVKVDKRGETIENAIGSIIEALILELLNKIVLSLAQKNKKTITTQLLYEASLVMGEIIPSHSVKKVKKR